MSHLVRSLEQHVIELLRRHGVDDDTAGDDARQLCEGFCREWGGERRYIPTLARWARHRAIREGVAAGKDQREVATDLGVHPKTVSRALRPEDDEEFGSRDWNL